MQVKIIRTIDGKTTVTDTTITATSDANDIRKILGQQHPFFYQNTQVTPICRKAEPGRTPDDASEMRKNIERKVWIRDTTVQRVLINGPIALDDPEEIRNQLKIRDVEIMRSPSVIRLEKDADGNVREIKLDGKPMEIEKLLKEGGMEPGTMHIRSAEPIKDHRFTIISHDSLHSLDAQELRVFRSSEEGNFNSRIIVLMSTEKPEAVELVELQEQNENIPTPKRELDANNLSLYPNPSSGRFTLSFELEDKGNTSIRVYNETGREVYSEQVKDLKGTYNKEIDISGNPQGVYFVQVPQGKKGFTRKVLLQ